MNHIEIISALLSKINPSKIVIIADANLMQLCPGYFNFIPSHFSPYMLAIPSGEKSKSLTEATYIWQNMLENNFDKDSLLINFGGGMICDLGGFVAANYKRGIRLLNIPTTLLAMIDAAIGGKNGLNLHHIKNAIGSIHLPEEVIIDTQFLMTLSPLQLLNGWGELIKYALIGDQVLWQAINKMERIHYKSIKKEWIDRCIQFKNRVVEEDLYDTGPRRILNFGHTIGHALESLSFDKNNLLPHGHAIAIGMVCESYLSYLHHHVSLEDATTIKQYIQRLYFTPTLSELDFKTLIKHVRADKKNSHETINITLLDALGKASPNHTVTEEEVIQSLQWLQQ